MHWGLIKEKTPVYPQQLAAQLAHFTGSETFTRHGLARGLLMTEGVVFLAEAAAAHWLTDAIASHQHDARARSEEFQAWKLIVNPETRQATLMMTDGNGKDAIWTCPGKVEGFP